MRVELTAIKAAIEVAMSHDIELDDDVPEELLGHMAALHSGIVSLEAADTPKQSAITGGI